MRKLQIDFNSWFYKNCRIQRKREAKICQVCPFREYIESEERKKNERNFPSRKRS